MCVGWPRVVRRYAEPVAVRKRQGSGRIGGVGLGVLVQATQPVRCSLTADSELLFAATVDACADSIIALALGGGDWRRDTR